MDEKRLKSLHSQPGHVVAELALTREDFRLVNYVYPRRFLKSRPHPLRIIESPPSAATYANVVYKPTTVSHMPHNGCLFDENLRRIDESCFWKGTNDIYLSNEPLYFQRGGKELASYDRPTLYLGHLTWHYGHFLLESLARWWILAEHAPEVDRFLIHVTDRSVLDLPFVQACLALAGIDRQQLVYFDRPVKIKEVILPEATFQRKSHVYTAYRKVWANLLASADTGVANKTSQPLYISRSLLTGGSYKYLGEEKIQTYLEGKGVRIVHPQKLSFGEQIRLFNEHEQIFGIIGSGMHNIVLSKAPKSVVYLTPHAINENYLLIDKCFDVDSTFLQACVPSELPKSLWIRFRARAKLIPRSAARGLLQVHQLDHKRVIDWFENSGLL